jgi:hypothetical protein
MPHIFDTVWIVYFSEVYGFITFWIVMLCHYYYQRFLSSFILILLLKLTGMEYAKFIFYIYLTLQTTRILRALHKVAGFLR